MTYAIDPFDPFRAALDEDAAKAGSPQLALAAGLIGDGHQIPGPFGPKPLIYADYTASGRPLRQIEDFLLHHVLPFYANSHTEASYCGAHMTRMRRAARAIIAEACHAGPEHAVVFCGAGATAGLNRLVALWQVGPGTRVLLGPYEHHSNILPWRESGAEVITLAEDPQGGPDRAQLQDLLADQSRRTICAFSAASNITGICADVAALTQQIKAADAMVVWDYAGGGPYLPIDLQPLPGVFIDAVVISAHKFIGGPGASGVMVVRKASVCSTRPSQTGGGTVRFVAPDSHDYTANLEAREEAGTPNVLGDIRAALAFLVKARIGQDHMRARATARAQRVRQTWGQDPRIELLGKDLPGNLPVFSFRLRNGQGGYLHHQLVTRLLSDVYGIQARGGCACAGPYVHDLLAIEPAQSAALRAAILAGDEQSKPGFVRLNFSPLMSDAKVETILLAVQELAETDVQNRYAALYACDRSRAIFTPIPSASPQKASITV